MLIRKVAVGNKEESFVESGFGPGLNVISSDDNNKGKTIVVQSIMYALGGEPAFPASFEYVQYYYIIEFEVEGRIISVCRSASGFVVRNQTSLMIFDNVAELKRYWRKHIYGLPVIIKDQSQKIVDPVLFNQLFFVGQDKKDTSNIAHSSYYRKSDFMEMLYSIAGFSGEQMSTAEIDGIKNTISQLKEERKILLQQHRILKSKNSSLTYLSTVKDRDVFSKKIASLEEIRSRIEELRKLRNRTQAFKIKWQTTIKELRSLNIAIESGELRCLDCNSAHISFSVGKKRGFVFDVSTVEMRKQIIGSIEDKIADYDEEIGNISHQIAIEQERINELLVDESISLESLVAYRKDVFSASEAEVAILRIDNKIKELESQLLLSESASKSNRAKRDELSTRIIEKMNNFYSQIDPAGNIRYNGLFTSKNELYSGSEATVFHFVKLLALREVLGHYYPIIIDSFRAEDLSTTKENVIIALCHSIPNQKIFTTTLKAEEIGKYDNVPNLNHIDYLGHNPSKILTPAYNDEFRHLLANLTIEI